MEFVSCMNLRNTAGWLQTMINLMHKVFSTFITVLYMYMFRAISCSSSVGQIVLTQHLVSSLSLSVSDRPVHRLRKNYFLSLHKIIILSVLGTTLSSFIYCVSYTPPYTHRQQYINKDKIVPNTDNFMIFAILHFYNFILVIDTTVQNNDNEISLHFKPMRLVLWITVFTFLKFYYLLVIWWWPGDRGRNMLSPCHLKSNKYLYY